MNAEGLLARQARVDEAGRLAELINAAFRVEDFFKAGDRTDADEVRRLMSTGAFLVLEAAGDPTSTVVACAYVETQTPVAYFGMLSVDPACQRRGLGRRMMREVEQACRRQGCHEVEIHVVNLRQELLPIYRALGYVETGTMPFPDDGSATRPCHFVVMRKPLA